MKKLESTLPNMFIVLTLIALVSASALAVTNFKTAPILEELARQRRIQAVAQVVPAFDNIPTEESFFSAENPQIEIFPATREGESVGYAVQSLSTNAYSGSIELMVGFDREGAVTGLSILRHQETPGLGARITEEEFRSRFVGLRPAEQPVAVVNDGGTVDAITAATISSRAVAEAVQRGWKALEGGAQ
ncbi:electron transport complex protein RnfG [Alkalispirochaeta americana]|uniref:Ion-translocating oxidoreductase complex subunit G n=1 Tax=Alkalispirochaeta americana TaxID=159291 RepID=A0A1N6N4P2_9SPIO|nr:RnfABCDGE type electron transport complex subunit G [Alkalispirochaeta americana]SIP87023.1 electron transport complex protein RnfG [Alkalispirochaeta americana]